jgi:hypothetical protein
VAKYMGHLSHILTKGLNLWIPGVLKCHFLEIFLDTCHVVMRVYGKHLRYHYYMQQIYKESFSPQMLTAEVSVR